MHGTTRRAISIFLLCLFLAACAKERAGQPPEKIPEREMKPGPSRSVNPSQRSASESLVNKGLAEYRAGDLAKAMRSFQDAITIDGQNGVAYYYLAQICLEEENTTDAAGFLDKAEVLFADNPEWFGKVQKLRKLME